MQSRPTKEQLISELKILKLKLELYPSKKTFKALLECTDKTTSMWLNDVCNDLQHQLRAKWGGAFAQYIPAGTDITGFVTECNIQRSSLEREISKLEKEIDNYTEGLDRVETGVDGETNHQKIIEADLRRKEQNSWGIDNSAGKPKNERRPFSSW